MVTQWLFVAVVGAVAAYAVTWACKAIINHVWPPKDKQRRWLWRPLSVVLGAAAGLVVGPELEVSGWPLGLVFGALGGTMTTTIVAAVKGHVGKAIGGGDG